MADNINVDEANERLGQFAEFLDRFGGASVDTFAELNKLKKGTEAYNKAQKELWNSLTNSLKRFDKQIQNGTATLEDYADHLEKLDDAIEHATDAAQKEALERDRAVIAEKARQKQLNDSSAQVSKALTSGAVKGSSKFVTSLQEGASATQVSSAMFSVAIDTASESVKGIKGIASALLGGVADRFLGKATGAGVRKIVDASAEMVTAGLKFANAILSAEVEKTIKAFHDMSASGAMFSDGMTGMRNASAASGLTLAQFSNVVKNSTEQLAASGMGMSTAVKMVGEVGTVLKKTGLQNQLLKLGVGFEEQAELTAQVMADMRASQVGPLRANKEVIAQETAKYAENLRIISAITGEDAKKKMDQARQQSTQLAFQQKLAGMDETQRRQVLEGMAAMPEALRKNYMDLVVFGHVVNKEGAAMAALSPNMRRAGEEAYQLTMQNRYNLEAQADISKRYNAGMQKDILGMTQIGMAGFAKTGGLGQALAEQFGGMLQELKKATPEAIAEAQQMAEAQKNASDKLTTGVTNAAIAAQNLANDLESILTPAVGDYAAASAFLLDVIEDAARAAGLEVGPRISQVQSGYTGLQKYDPNDPYNRSTADIPTRPDPSKIIEFDKKYIAESEKKANKIRKQLEENAKLNPLAPEAMSSKKVKELTDELNKLTAGISSSIDEIKSLQSQITKPTSPSTPARMAKITAPNGKSAFVDANEQARFQGFINDANAMGYKINDLMGYQPRSIKGTNKPSHHAFGHAIDINPATNPHLSTLKTDMPAWMSQLSAKWGLGWGGDWKSSKDPMHFSTAPNEGGRSMSQEETNRLLAVQNEYLKKIADGTLDANQVRKKILDNSR